MSGVPSDWSSGIGVSAGKGWWRPDIHSTAEPDVDQAHQMFVEAIRGLEARLCRLESITALFLVRVRYCTFKAGPFQKWFEARATDKTWRPGHYGASWTHEATGVSICLPDSYDVNAHNHFLEVLLTVAACEGRIPADLLLEIDADAFPSAIDALGTLIAEDS